MTSTRDTTRRLLQGHQLAPKKALGQNFLVHRHTAQAIVHAAGVGADDIVVEVGVGLGALTQPLAAAARQVYGYEVDRGIVRMHHERQDLPDNVTLIHEDILAADFSQLAERCGGRILLVANLPYSITNPFLFQLIDNAPHVNRAVVMVQKEVADRLTAGPCTKEYGVPTVLLACCATVRQLLLLKPGEFHPRPKIDSVVIAIDFFPPSSSQHQHMPQGEAMALLKTVVRATFNQRRKTIANSLLSGVMPQLSPGLAAGAARQVVEKVLASLSISPQARPESLTVEDFIALARHLGGLAEESFVAR